jgi:NAD+ kinase
VSRIVRQDTPIRTVALVSKPGRAEGARLLAEAAHWLRERRIRVRFDARTAAVLKERPSLAPGKLPRGTDLAIVAGGDGTLLSVARAAASAGVPILGVNFGGLGFLTELHPDELFPALARVLRREHAIEERQALRARIRRAGSRDARARRVQRRGGAPGGPLTHGHARRHGGRRRRGLLHERRPDRGLPHRLHRLQPLRRRAHPRSPDGGLRHHPHLPSWHDLSARWSSPEGARWPSPSAAPPRTTSSPLDGQIGFPLHPGDTVTVDAHPGKVRLVRVSGRSFFQVLPRKLRWGASKLEGRDGLEAPVES